MEERTITDQKKARSPNKRRDQQNTAEEKQAAAGNSRRHIQVPSHCHRTASLLSTGVASIKGWWW
jgi:hypothetical protein